MPLSEKCRTGKAFHYLCYVSPCNNSKYPKPRAVHRGIARGFGYKLNDKKDIFV